jgi:DNA modification methylase
MLSMTRSRKLTNPVPKTFRKLPKYSLVSTTLLTPYANNAKLHPPEQVAQIAASMVEFGFINAIFINSDYEIIAGHGRWLAAKLLGLKKVPVIFIDHLTKAQVKAYRLADNQLTLNTGNDECLLRIAIKEVIDLEPGFELEVIGYETAQLDLIIDGNVVHEDDPADALPDVDDSKPVVTKLDDIWIAGKHRLICGNALDPKCYERLLLCETAHMCFSDPPYNLRIDGHVCGNGKIKHTEFAMASGEMSTDEFTAFLASAIALMIKHSRDGSLHYICMDWRHMFELLSAGRAHFTELKNICVWNKNNGGMGSFYRSKHELVAVFKNGTKPHLNTIELGKHGRYRTNVWDYPGVNGFAGKSDLEMHPTVKPVAMIADAIKDCTKRGHIVLDPFAGSGSTLMACEKSGRIARCIELEPKYCDVIIRRWQDFTGQDAIHSATGKTFNQT